MKLFALEEIKETEVDIEEHQEEGIDGLNIEETVDEYRDDFRVATESVNAAICNLSIVDQIKTSVESKKIASPEYFITIENINLYMKSISSNLGLKIKVPSIEDFKNPYGTETCHEIVIEGFMDVVRSIWEKIKQFFKEFFNKIKLFFKRLIRADLDMHEYEEHLEKVMARVKTSKKDEINGEFIQSKLPEYLAGFRMESINTRFMLQIGKEKLSNLTNTCEGVNKNLKRFIEAVSFNIRDEYIEKLNRNERLENDDLYNLKTRLMGVYSEILPVVAISNNIPDSLLEDIQRDILEDTDKIRAHLLTEFKLDETDLPNNLNIGYFSFEDNLINYVTSYKEKNDKVKNTILTIENRNDLIKMYDFYKKYKKDFNVSQADKHIESMGKIVDALIKDLENMDIKMMRKIDTQQNNQTRVDSSADYEDFKEGYIAGINNNQPEHDSSNIYKIGFYTGKEFLNTTDEDKKRNSTDEAIRQEYSKILNKLGISEANSSALDSEQKEIIKQCNSFLLNYLNSVQKLISVIYSDLYGDYIKCKYELLKYIFKSADLYK